MKKIIITCALLTSASMMSFGQTQTPSTAQSTRPAQATITPDQMAQRRTKMDEKMLNLTPEQSKSVYDVELEFMTALDKYRAAGQQPNEGQIGNLQTRRDQKMKEILTADQYTKYETVRNARNTPHTAPVTAAQPGQNGK